MSSASKRRGMPNEFEIAILRRLPVEGVRIDAQSLDVVSREITGAGSYTTFALSEPLSGAARSHIGLNELIELTGVPNGLGAVLWLRGGVPECLEIYTYGEDAWDGSFDGYKITELPNTSLERTRGR